MGSKGLVDISHAIAEAQPLDELVKAKAVAEQAVDRITKQLEAPKYRRRSSETWRDKAVYALKSEQSNLFRINAILDVRVRQDLSALFMAVAEEKLDPTMFAIIKLEAKRRCAKR